MVVLEQIIKNEYANHWPNLTSKVAVCMSGGVDSSVAAYLLTNKGYETIGLTGWLIKGAGRCCDNGMVDAAKVSEELNIQHISKDLRIFFKQEIVDPFIASYSIGSTPIPCITCNNVIKWGSLMDYAFSELGCTHIATGHYAKIIREGDLFKIVRSKDIKKDQTFMLWGLTQKVLSKTVFPLGELTKEEVREIAKEANLIVADKEESQDICFVSDKEGTQGFLSKFLDKKEGFIIESKTGKVLGMHQGTQNYTIGQRKGLGIAYSEPLYVIELDVENNIVYAGTQEELDGYELIAKDVNFIVDDRLGTKNQGQSSHGSTSRSVVPCPMSYVRVMAKIRYNSKTSPAKVELLSDNKVKVIFDKPQSAITPGQACVFYDESDQILLGGGWIC
ncbi:MAG: tRNA 2-thiouridine(34) synthase MnmA [Candidatus Melainabacteria bacterium]|nr:tRNA 2-thiouridine(34) synthase MnmA [Candidatus Melainabacteria bacterium]